MSEIIALLFLIFFIYLILKWLFSPIGLVLCFVFLAFAIFWTIRKERKKRNDNPASAKNDSEYPEKHTTNITADPYEDIDKTDTEQQPFDSSDSGSNANSSNLNVDSSKSSTFALESHSAVSKSSFAKERPKIFSSKPNIKDFIVIDTETTGLSLHNDKVVQLAALKYVDDRLIGIFNKYINPEGVKMSEMARLTTGITDEDLKDKPSFEDIIPEFQNFVGNNVWIGHNINSFDIPILFYNGYRQPKDYAKNEFVTIDTYSMAKDEMSQINVPDYKLTTLKDYFNLTGKSHDALGDCEVTAALYQRLRDGNLTPEKVEADAMLINKRFCITGSFEEASRHDIVRMIELHGGKVTKGVSHLTDYLVDGKQVSSQIKDGKSRNEKKAEEYGTTVISYSDLMKMLASSSKK